MAMQATNSKMTVAEILNKYTQGFSKDFDAFVSGITNLEATDKVLIEGLRGLRECVSLLEKEHFELFVSVLLRIKWADRDRKVVRAYQCFIEDLISAKTTYLPKCLNMIVRQFIPVMTKDELEKDISDETRRKHDQIFFNLHPLLKFSLEKVPMTETLLVSLLAECYPHESKAAYLLECYLQNLLRLTLYWTKRRRQIMELIVVRINKIDGRCSREDICEAEGDSDDEEEEEEEDDDEEQQEDMMFPMELDKAETNVKLEPMTHKDANKLDILMQHVFRYIQGVCYSNDDGKLNWDETKKLYMDLLSAFQRIILPTHASCHIQFLLFYIISFKAPLVEGFLDFLWKRVQNPNEPPIFRQTAVAYMGSLLARANYIDINIVRACVDLMVEWIHRYLKITSDSMNADIGRHRPFYAVCQSVFYVFAFKHKELLNTERGHKFCQGLNLQTIVMSRLNPLRVCLPVVANTFASVTREQQLAFCDTILEHNRRNMLPIVGASSDTMNPLDTFFPFDPYLLRRSGIPFILPLYTEFQGSVQEEAMDSMMMMPEDEEFEDEPTVEGATGVDPLAEMMGITPQSPPTSFIYYGTSPGFKTMSQIHEMQT